MGDQLGKMFVPLKSLPGLYDLPVNCIEPHFDPDAHFHPTYGGVFQLIFLAFVYAFVLFEASNMIADGSELLLLIPEMAQIVGSVVLPILGAVPDGAIVLFSGLGPRSKVQEELAVGVGAMAGSTVMLLTVPWFLSIFAGRVDIIDGVPSYSRPKDAGPAWKKLDPKRPSGCRGTGVQADNAAMKSGAKMMVLTSLGYVIIQGSAFAYAGSTSVAIVRHEKFFALIGFTCCMILFVVYIGMQLKDAGKNEVMKDLVDQRRQTAIRSGLISLHALFENVLENDEGDISKPLLTKASGRSDRFSKLVRNFFHKYDLDKDGTIDPKELVLLLKELHMPSSTDNVTRLMKEIDTNSDGRIQFEEFVTCLRKLIQNRNNLTNVSVRNEGSESKRTGRSASERRATTDEEEEEEEEIPEDLADLPPAQQRKRIIFRSFRLMLCGTALVILFSDPMVNVLMEIGNLMNIPAFYISFLLAPLASNASELLASYKYAQKKTRKTITISLTALEGAAIMNNTFCLGIFLALVYFRELQWSFTAETLSILAVEFVMFFFAGKQIETLADGFLILLIFPISLLLTLFLEKIVGLD